MEEIRCPMCGRPNPADRDVCQFCEARLKPLTGPLSEDDSPSTSRPEEDDDDWLGSLRSEADMADEDDSDWSEEEVEVDGEHQRDPLDWLSSMDDQSEPAPPADRQPEAPQPAEPVQPVESEAESEQVDLSAWLASLDEDEEPEGEAQPAEEMPDWLREFESTRTEPQPESEDEDLPDWLTGLGERQADAQALEASEPEAQELEAQELEAPELEAPELESPELDAPELQADEFEMEAPEDLGELFRDDTSREEPQAEEEALPDWLSGIGAAALSAADEPAAAEEEPPVHEPEEGPDTDESPVPDWVRAAGAASFAAAASEEAEPVEPESEEPDWLGESQAEAPAADVEAEPGAEEVEWSADLAEEEPLSQIEETGPLGEAETLEPAEMPDWLADLEPEESLEQTGELPEGDLPAPSQETAEWLSDLASDVEGGPEESDLGSPFTFEGRPEELSELDLADEPEWLSELDEQAGEKPAAEGEADIARADLPEWLAAMRPVDSIVTPRAVPGETGMDVESAGPLSGLHDVLPAEPDVFQISKPEVQAVKLNVSDSQQKHIAMLNQMMKEDTRPPAAVPVEGPGLQRVLRWLISLALIIAAVFGLFSGFSISELPVPAPEARAANQAIETLPSQAPVLVAFDYEPALSGEMEPLATALLNHLMLRGVNLTLVSTTPTGPVLAEAVLQDLQQQHNYQRGAQYVNLGYIPGGANGLQSFSSFPIQLLLPYTFSGYQAWEPRLAPLAGVESLADYALVLVLTDRQETARAWVEQVGPVLEQSPMLFGSSAQIEPYLRPYYAGSPNLVDGFVSGIAGSGAYERLIGVDGWTSNHWNVYTLLVMVAAAAVLLGGLINLILGSRRPTANVKGEAGQ